MHSDQVTCTAPTLMWVKVIQLIHFYMHFYTFMTEDEINNCLKLVILRAMTHTAINCGNIMAQLSCAIILPVCHSYCGNFKKLPLVFSQ